MYVELERTGKYRFVEEKRMFRRSRQILEIQVLWVSEVDYGQGPDRSPPMLAWRPANRDDISDFYARGVFNHA